MPTQSLLPAVATDTDRLRLFCLPHAGGGLASFFRWQRELPAGWSAQPVQLPGRDARRHDPPYNDVLALVSDLADEISVRVERPYVVVGNSFGALVGFELLRELMRRRLSLPQLFVVAGFCAPHVPRERLPIANLPPDELLAALQSRYGGIPAKVRQNPELLEMMLPAIRADFHLLEEYRYEAGPPLPVPLLAIAGQEDRVINLADLQAWAIHTTEQFSAQLVPGGHLALTESSGTEPPAAVKWLVSQISRQLQCGEAVTPSTTRE